MKQKRCTESTASAIRTCQKIDSGSAGSTGLPSDTQNHQTTSAKIYYFPGCAPARDAPGFRLQRSYFAVTMDEDGNEFASIAGSYKDSRQLMRALGELLLQKSSDGAHSR